MERLTKRQQAILDFIQKETQERGYPPSQREIGAAVGLASASTVHGHLERLEKRGLLMRDKLKPRGIKLIGKGANIMSTLEEDDDKEFDRIFENVKNTVKNIYLATLNNEHQGISCPSCGEESIHYTCTKGRYKNISFKCKHCGFALMQ